MIPVLTELISHLFFFFVKCLLRFQHTVQPCHGARPVCVRNVWSPEASSSHLPLRCSQPDLYPQLSGPRWLIPSKRLPVGGRQRQGGAVGAPHRGPLTWFPGPTVQSVQTDSTASPPLLSATQTPGAEGEMEVGEGEGHCGAGEGSGANEHNEETDTDCADHPLPPPPSPPPIHSSLDTDLSIPYGRGCCPLPLAPL